MDKQLAENKKRHQLVQQEASYKQQVQKYVRQSSTQFVQTNTDISQVTKTATTAAVQQNVLNTDSDDYKQQISNAQRKFLDLEEELKSTRSKIGTLNLVCANTEEKIGELKNLEGTYQDSYTTVIRQNGASKTENRQIQNITVHLKGGQQTFVGDESIPCEKAEISMAFPHEPESEASNTDNRQLQNITVHLKGEEQQALVSNESSPYERAEFSMAFPHEPESEAVNELKVIVKKLNDENEPLHQQLQNVKRDKGFADSQSEIKSLKGQISMLEGQLQQADYTELQRTQQLQDALRECNEKRGEALKTIEAFRSQVAAYDKRIEGLDASLVQTRTRNADLEKKMSNFPRRLRELERDLNCSKKDKESKERKLKELSNRVLVLEQELSEANLEKERFRLQITENQSKLDLQIKLHSEQLSDAQMRCEMLQKEAEDKEKNIKKLVKEKTKMGTELCAFKSQLVKKTTNEYDEMNALKDEVNEWKKRYDELKIENGDLEKKSNLLVVEIQELKKKIKQSEDQQRREQQRLQELLSREKQCKEQIVAQEEENVKLLREIKNMQSILSERDEELHCKKEEVLFLEDEAQKLRLGYEDVLKSQEESSRGSEEEKSFLRRENDTWREVVQQLQEDIQAQLKEKEPLVKENETLKRQYDHLQAEMVELGKKHESNLEESNYLREKLKEYENSRQEIVISLEQEIATIRNRETKLQEEHTAQRTEIEKLTNENDLLRKRLDEQTNDHDNNKANLRKETELLQRKIFSLQQELFSVRKEMETLTKENNSLNTMLKEDEQLHEKDKESLQRRITNLEHNSERLEREINRLRTEKESLNLEGKKLKGTMKKEKETSEKQINDLQQQISLLQEETDKLHTGMAVVVKENDSLSTEKDSLIKENDDLRRLRDNETSLYDQEKESLQSHTVLLEKKFNKLQRDSDELNKQISSLKNKNENLKLILEREKLSSKANMDNYVMENERLRKQMDDQKNLFAEENAKFKKELLGITTEKESLLRHVCSSEEQTDELYKELKKLRKTLEQERHENKKLESSLSEEISFLQEEVEKLQLDTTNSIKEMGSLSMEKEYILEEKDELQQRLDEEKSISDQYKEERVLLHKEKEEIEQQLTALKEQNLKLEKELSTSREDCMSFKEEFENYKHEVIILETQLATVSTDVENERIKEVKVKEELEKQLAFLDKQNREMKEEMSRLQHDLDENSKIRDTLKRENTDVKKTLAEIKLAYKNSQDNLQCQITKLEEDITTVTTEKDHLRSENVHLENKISTFQDQITAMDQDLSDLQNEVDRLTEKNKELKSHIVTTQAELAEQRQRFSNVQVEKKIQASSCTAMQDKVSKLEKELEKTQQDFAILLQENGTLKVDLKTFQEETKMDKDDKENYLRKIDSLQEKITKMKSELANVQTENKDLKGRFVTVNKELSLVQMEKEYQVKQNEDLKRQITAFRDQIARLNKDFLNLQKEKENFAKENKILKSQLVVLQEKISKVNREFSNFQADRDYLIKEKEELYEALKREKELYKRDKEAFQQRIKVLQEERMQEETVKPAVEEQIFCEAEDTVDAIPDENGEKLQELQDSFDIYREEQETKANKLSVTIAGLEDELASLKKLKRSLNDELLAFKNSSQLKQEQLTSANERNSQLKVELTNKEQTITELRRKMTRLAELELELSQCQELSEELVQAREEILHLEDAHQDNEFLRQIMSEIENDRDKLWKDKNELQEKVYLLSEELMHLKSLQPELKEKNQMLSNLQDDKNLEIETLTQRITELESRHTLVEKTAIIETESRIMIKEKEIRELKERFDAKCNECEHHLKELQDARSMNAEFKIDQAWKLRYDSLKIHYKELEKENSILQNEKRNAEKQLEIFQNKVTITDMYMQENDNSKKLIEENTNVVDGKLPEGKKEAEELQVELEQAKQEILSKKNILLSHEKQLRSLRLEVDIKETKINRIKEEKEQLQARIIELEDQMKQPDELQLTNNNLDNEVKNLRSHIQELESEITSLRAQLETKIETIEEISLEKITIVTQITKLEKTVTILTGQIEDTDKVVLADSVELESRPVLKSTKSSTLNIDVQGHPIDVQSHPIDVQGYPIDVQSHPIDVQGNPEVVRFEVLMTELDSIVAKPREVSTLFIPITPVSSDFKHQEIKINSEQDQEEIVIVVPVTPVNSQTPKVGDSDIVAVLVKVRDNESDNSSISSSITSESAPISFISEEDAQDETKDQLSDKQVGPLRYKFEYPKQGPTALPLVRDTPPIHYPTEILDVQPDEDPQTAIRKSSKSAAEKECFVEPDLPRARRRHTEDLSEPKNQVPVKERVSRANTEPVFTLYDPRQVKNAADSKTSSHSTSQDEDENEFCLAPTDAKPDKVDGTINPVPKTRPKNKGILTVEQYDVPPDPNNNFTTTKKPHRFSFENMNAKNEDPPQSPLKISFVGVEKNQPECLPVQDVRGTDKVPERLFTQDGKPGLGRKAMSLRAPLKSHVPDEYASDSSADYYRPSTRLSAKPAVESADQQNRRKPKKKKGLLRKNRNSERFRTMPNNKPVMSFDI